MEDKRTTTIKNVEYIPLEKIYLKFCGWCIFININDILLLNIKILK